MNLNIPFNIYTATEEEIGVEAERRIKEIKTIESTLKKYKQYYFENPSPNMPRDLIDCSISYNKLKEYYKEISTSVFYQEMLRNHLASLEQNKTDLSGFEILQEIENVLRLRLPCPDWLYKEFSKRFLAVAEGHTPNFGTPISFGSYPFSQKSHKIRNYKGVNLNIYLEIEGLLKKGWSLTGNNGIYYYLYDKMGISPKQIEKIYYNFKDSLKDEKKFDLLDPLVHRVGNR